ncbi:hypothetical protein [Acinetobacter nosocomialis]|uniref:hypothetical protein n=1 Tax=Acinetobacter nosocomialis TaxID=106654 RepID=UPI0024DEF16C|nr:hypothetical protein [Acinetobacter nosocomialis]
MKIKNFPEDAKITFLGEIFKFNHLKSWNIKLGIHADSELSVKHSRLSNLPAFARGRCLNPSDGQCRKGGYKININIQSNEDWKVKVDPKNRGYYFEFDFNRGSEQNPDLLHIRIPQIELARVLFFHNAYLARNCIDQGILAREFFVDPIDQTTTVIHVLPHRTFPLGQFNNEGIRRLLSWILLDENARQSYESIAHYFKLEAKQFEEKTSWKFHFTPPQLINISLKCLVDLILQPMNIWSLKLLIYIILRPLCLQTFFMKALSSNQANQQALEEALLALIKGEMILR